MYEYTTGTRPDWENVGIEFPEEICSRGRQIIARTRELTPDAQLPVLAPVIMQAIIKLLEAFPKLTEDEEARKYLDPKVKSAIGRKLYIEIVASDGEKYGFILRIVDLPQLFAMEIGEYDPDVVGIRIIFDDLIGFLDSCLEEGRIVIPDILDFLCRGKMEILPTYGRRADWSAMPVVGALIFLTPKLWTAFEQEKILEKVDQELQKVKI